MRVCLINLPCIEPKLWGKHAAFQTLDIAYVAVVLEKVHNVKSIVLNTSNSGSLIL